MEKFKIEFNCKPNIDSFIKYLACKYIALNQITVFYLQVCS